GTDGPVALRPSQLVEPEAEFVLEARPRFVSRGGIKLDNALEALAIDVAGRECLDVGASTGGFTDCLLQRGAAHVAAVDVAYGQLELRLREDPRVTVIERLNARELAPADLPFAPSLATVDVSFISLTKILPAVAACLALGGEVLAMVKPQFELGRERVGRGVVRDDADRREAILAVAASAAELGLSVRGFAPSGLPGPKGNRETFVLCGGEGAPLPDFEAALLEAEQ
ncbi:MAG TPA: TlyA family RNA methyltransferase, partial [Solirubrobacterales bacterium]